MKRKRDEGYDGYYNDVLPGDSGQTRDGVAPELIKRVALVIGAALVVIILAVVMMTLL